MQTFATVFSSRIRLKYFTHMCCAVVAAMCLTFIMIAIFGGSTGVEFVGTRIKFNMAIGLIACASSLSLLNESARGGRRETFGHGFAVVAFLIGALTLYEYLTGHNLGIDERFVIDFRNQESMLYPGRPAPNAALCLVVLGLSLLMLDGKKWVNRMAQRLALIASVIGLFALFGYAFEAQGLYRISKFIRISPYASLGVVTLSAGILFARPQYGIVKLLLNHYPSGIFARRMLITAVVSPTLLGLLGMLAERQGYVDSPTAAALVALTTVLIIFALVWHSAASMNETEIALNKSEAHFRTMANSIPQLAWMTDHTGYTTWYNQKWYDYTGTTLEQTRGWGWQALHDPEYKMRVTEKFLHHIRSGQFWEDTYPLRGADGKYRWFLSQALPIRDEHGNVTHWFGTNTDITETIEAKEIAEKANQAKTQFLANMSHEIRTPVGAIIGFTEMLKNEANSSSDQMNFMSIIQRNSQSLLRLIDDILDLSKVEAGKIAIETSTFNLPEFLIDLNVLMNLRATEKSIIFLIQLENSIPEQISTDPLRLRQILTNVVGNAIKFTDRGQVILKVKSLDTSLQFSVVDTGPGISSESIGKLFYPFSQADPSLTRKFGGTGLGLILSKRLSQALGGDLNLMHTELGKGSTFTSTIQVVPVANVRMISADIFQRPGHLIPRSTEQAGKLTGLNILFVDDSADNRVLVGTYLRKTGAQVSFAEDGADGVSKAFESAPDIILMDIQMPKMDGHAATRKLRESGFTKPIIALTAHAMREERDRCFESGCTDYLTKPIQREQLIDTLANYIPAQP